MSTSGASATWDFTPAINLLYSFKPEPQPKPIEILRSIQSEFTEARNHGAASPSGRGREDNSSGKLGDFSALWTFLSQPSPTAPDNIERGATPGVGASDCKENQRTNLEEASAATVECQPELCGMQPKKILPNKRNPPSVSSAPPGDTEATIPECRPIQILKNPNRIRRACLPTPPRQESLGLAERPQRHPPRDIIPLVRPPNTPNRSLAKHKYQVESKLGGSTAEKRSDLISHLYKHHRDQRLYLANPKLCDSAFISSNISSNGIHIFVDISNVMVGFHDCIKIARDIPTTVRVPRLPLSFHNLSLVLTRGRPVSKRVIVGSDRFPAIDEAEKLGYETNILVRVQKLKEATPQKNQVSKGRGTVGAKCCGNKQQDQSSGSESSSNKPVPEKWVEQAVDEILHLKILESIVDTDEPSTIVLVTGDAAEAEYSQGFMKMVERALMKGWTVELVSFSCTISRAYTGKAFRSKWGSKFSIIELDRYAEHLLDM
ncbi:uncharacterized protein CIMG_10809 [Coccidioides immitis RS]|uniref:NYN domain-containing protein n=3 Tax=Coccidioides immitis TaxID=5501 RepID=A0A0D8JT43_COCIM|nr:uncharacterized protein CIMG_10809 [Coccidioides immitis RS]KJF60116.1 hypothetical protein CIMG_10809 [Coccidioides immitis RS]KMP01747.1 hypothetical protein CIRG_01886 [Coccidioides immitis RMSCC 2394]KMU76270.1 hypothetical protein CISG_01005 [Coccidioides immitis RMSCC 3703]TPX25477.1 hypothetical protein DIZ76_010932 [Coccidioides immitis]